MKALKFEKMNWNDPNLDKITTKKQKYPLKWNIEMSINLGLIKVYRSKGLYKYYNRR